MNDRILLCWHTLPDRERKILAIWGAVAALLVVWFGLLSPLAQRIVALEKRVPALELQLNRMRARPLDSVRPIRSPGEAAGDLRSLVFGLLAERKINAELRALSTSRVEMRLPEMPVREALDLIDGLRQESGARVAQLNMQTEAHGAAARVVVELERGP